MKRYVEEKSVLRRVPAEHREKLKKFLAECPTAPDLVSRKAAAKILQVASPYITRLVDQGRMPEPIDVEGGAPGYVREEIYELKEELDEERERRRRGREQAEEEEREVLEAEKKEKEEAAT